MSDVSSSPRATRRRARRRAARAPSRATSTGLEARGERAGDVGLDVVADVQRVLRRDARQRQRAPEDRRVRLGGADLGRGHDAVDQRRSPVRSQDVVQRDVPVADDDEAHAAPRAAREHRGHLRDRRGSAAPPAAPPRTSAERQRGRRRSARRRRSAGAGRPAPARRAPRRGGRGSRRSRPASPRAPSSSATSTPRARAPRQLRPRRLELEQRPERVEQDGRGDTVRAMTAVIVAADSSSGRDRRRATLLVVLADRRDRAPPDARADAAAARRAGRRRAQPDADTRLRFLRRVVYAVILLVGIALALAQFTSLDRLAASVLASGAIAAAIIGFAARQVLANVIAGIMLAITQPLRVGDWVTFEGEYGVGRGRDAELHVAAHGVRDARMVIPNERLAAGILRNDASCSAMVALTSRSGCRPTPTSGRAGGVEACRRRRPRASPRSPTRACACRSPAPVAPPERGAREAELRAEALRACAKQVSGGLARRTRNYTSRASRMARRERQRRRRAATGWRQPCRLRAPRPGRAGASSPASPGSATSSTSPPRAAAGLAQADRPGRDLARSTPPTARRAGLHPGRRPAPPIATPRSRRRPATRRSRSRTGASTSTRASTTRASCAPRSRTSPAQDRPGRLDAHDAAGPQPLHGRARAQRA